jgi:hypothetical protein
MRTKLQSMSGKLQRRASRAARRGGASNARLQACAGGWIEPLSQSHSTLELHQRVLADLDQREAVVVEQEAKARRVLEQALAHCAAERTSIEQDRAVLEQAEKLYRRFIDTDGPRVPEDNMAQPEPPPRELLSVMEEPASPPQESSAMKEPASPEREPSVMMEPALPEREPSVMELRRQLWKDNQMDCIMQREAWAADRPPPDAPVGPPY